MRVLIAILALSVSVATAGNLVYNSGFELGAMGHSSARQKVGYNNFAETGVWTTNAHSGSYGISIVPQSGNNYSPRYIRLPVLTVTNYTISFWCKAGGSANYVMMAVNVYGSSSSLTNTTFLPTGSWSRFTRTVSVNPATSSELKIDLDWRTDYTLYIDDIQVELGSTATDYAPKDVVEVGWIGDKLGHIVTGDMAEKRAGLRLYSTATTNGTALVQFQDWNGKTVINLTTNLSLAVGLQTNWFSLPTSNGAYRAIARWNGGDNTPAESMFIVTPSPADLPATNAIFGAHFAPNAGQVDYWRTNFGIVHNRSLSPAAYFRWTTIEPTSNNFSWTVTDEAVNAVTNGSIILGSINDGTTFPSWALTNAYMPYVDKWSNYVYQIVNRYKDRITLWEDINEPQDTFTGHEADYATLMSMTVGVIKDLQPSATFVGFGGQAYTNFPGDVWPLLSAGVQAKIDAISCHIYPPHNFLYDSPQPDTRFLPYKVFGAAIGKPVWNTESGGYTRHQLRTFAYWERPAIELWRGIWCDPLAGMKQFVRSMGYGFTRYYYYDFRSAYPETDMGTEMYTPYNKDESLNTQLAMFTWAAKFLQNAPVTAGTLNHTGATGGVEAWLFDVGGSKSLLAMWGEDKTNSRTFTFAETRFAAYDVMGNQIATNQATLTLTADTIYLLSTTLSTNDLGAAFLASTIVTNADTTAPVVAFDDCPYGANASPLVRIRWTANDDLAMNNSATPAVTNALETRYSMNGGSWSGWSGTSWTYGPSNLANGTYTLTVEARDKTGNVGSYTSPQFIITGGGGGRTGTNNVISAPVKVKGKARFK